MTDATLNGEKNLLKRSTVSSSQDVAAPSVVGAWFNYVSTVTIPHNLGYVPQVRVFFESDAGGKIFPACGRRLAALATGISYGNVICVYEVDETNLTIYLESASAKTGSRKVYYIIYLDN